MKKRKKLQRTRLVVQKNSDHRKLFSQVNWHQSFIDPLHCSRSSLSVIAPSQPSSFLALLLSDIFPQLRQISHNLVRIYKLQKSLKLINSLIEMEYQHIFVRIRPDIRNSRALRPNRNFVFLLVFDDVVYCDFEVTEVGHDGGEIGTKGFVVHWWTIERFWVVLEEKYRRIGTLLGRISWRHVGLRTAMISFISQSLKPWIAASAVFRLCDIWLLVAEETLMLSCSCG
jgi:hypothetical protein